MTSAAFDVLGIGNAIVDVITHADDSFLTKHALVKGSMTLIDEARAETLYGAMGPGVEISGGSCGNTIAGVASFGGKGAYVGKVRNDQLGAVFGHDLRATGVTFGTAQATEGPSTARCLIVVTPDAQRTMNTFLGAAQTLTPDDIDANAIAASSITYLEGYLWDPPQAKEAFRKAAKIAHDNKRQVALTLSDSFCVSRYRAEFVELIRSGTVDLLFANESELLSLYETANFDTAVKALQADAKLAAVTRSEKGCVVVSKSGVESVPAAPIDRLVDATGAGDLFAAGFMFGLSRGRDHKTAARLGGLAAAEVIPKL